MKYISSQLYIYLQSVQAYIAPPIAACFLLGLFFRRLNGAGAVASLWSGLFLGLLRLVLELMNGISKTGLTDGTVWAWMAEINFLHFAVLLFVVSTFVLVGVSALTAAPTPAQLTGLSYGAATPGTPTGVQPAGTEGRKIDIGMSVLLAALLGVLWIIFA
jgi:SSS family solute:Na+ symporter